MKVWEIIRVIEESPVKAIDGDSIEITFETPEGFQYHVFFDCGEPDYLNWIQQPGEERIDFWPSPTDDSERSRAVTALTYLAGNLIALPHVAERLKKAAVIAGMLL